MQEFFQILNESDGLICGSAVRHVLHPYAPMDDSPLLVHALPVLAPLPSNLNLIVGAGRSQLLFNFLGARQYEYEERQPEPLYKKHITLIEAYTKSDSAGKVSSGCLFVDIVDP
jgi:hypothetical protein